MAKAKGIKEEEAVAAWQRHGTISGAARELGVVRDSIRHHLKAAGLYDERPMYAGRVKTFECTSRPLPKRGVKRYILTSAQNNTLVNQQVWDNLLALAEHYKAELLVSTFSYDKASYGDKSVKRGRAAAASDHEELWYDEQIEEYICDDQVEIAPALIFCCEQNIQPTAIDPLSGLQNYTRRKSGIIPHAKQHMQSVAVYGGDQATKFNFTTGTVTKRNYIQKKVGLKAEHYHTYGALIVEIDPEGRWFVRQLEADGQGAMYDMNLRVHREEITEDNRVEAITWGDIHVAEIDQEVAELAWGEGGMMDTLRPRYQFMHDVLDFRARNSYTIKKNLIHDRFQAYIKGHDSVEEEVLNVATFLDQASRDWCKTVVVHSNHDVFMMEWLRIGDYRKDPINALYFLETQTHVYKSIAADPDAPVNLLRWAIERVRGKTAIQFLDEDESFITCKDRDGGIENGMHGHAGPNGARGTARNAAVLGRRVNRGHEHSAGIFQDVFTSGLTGKRKQGYNKGPSSWSATHTVTYRNATRAQYTMWGGKWRA